MSAYAPTLTSSHDVKEKFYGNLDHVIKTTPLSDTFVLLGDFNARVEKDHSSWAGVLGKHGIGKASDNDLLLLIRCVEYNLRITNSLFRMDDKYKTSWMHPWSKHRHMIDFIFVRQRDIRDVRVTHVVRGAECWTGQRLVRSTMNLYIPLPRRNRPKTVKACYNTSNPSHLEGYQRLLGEKFPDGSIPSRGSIEKYKQVL